MEYLRGPLNWTESDAMEETHGTLSGSELPENDEDRLNSRDRGTVGELKRLDPHLAGLYERGLALVGEIDHPGNAYLVAHVGRELSRGVLERLLKDEGLEITAEDLQRVPKNERNRASIAKALRLEPDDPRVDEWFYLIREFSTNVHWRYGGPPSAAVREAFEQFRSLLYGRLAPYYVTEADLDALLKIETPTRQHAKQLRDVQLRPGQRNYFFRQLRNSAWVRHLAAERFFQSPPGRRTNDDGSWSANPWPEGDYLVLAAPHEPAAVLDVLNSIPLTNDNPVVWDLAAKAARQLPPETAVCVIPRLTNALKTLPAWFFTESVADLVVFLAESGREEAFDLSSFLLRVVDPNELRGVEGLGSRQGTEWVFPCFVSYDDGELLERVVRALEALDAERTLRLLLSKVQRVGRLSDDLELGWDRRLADLHSESQPGRADMVVMAINKTVGVGQRLAARGETEASWVMKRIDSYDANFMTRIGYLVLSEAGHHIQERVDQELGSSEMREPGHPATEIAKLLRSQFRNASRQRREEYAAAVEAGPSRDTLRNRLGSFLGRDPTDEEINQRIRRYQHRIITFFRGEIPDELSDLAERLGVLGATPSLRDQKLAEVGMYMGPIASGGWRGDESPISQDELAQSSAGEIVDLLVEQSGGHASSSGFRQTLTAYGTEHAEIALTACRDALDQDASPSALRAILRGVSEATDAGSDFDWAVALAVVRRVMGHVRSLPPDSDAGARQWRRTGGVAVRLLEAGCRRDSIEHEHAGEIWEIIGEAMTVSAIWDVAHSDDRSLGATLMADLNDATGNATNAAISVALWDYRSRVGDEREASTGAKAAARAAVQEKLVPVLDRWLQDDGPNAAVPRAVMGRYLPQLRLLAPEWLEAHANDLFDHGLENPAVWPTWTTYISRGRLYNDVFRATRFWYLRAAEQPTVWREAVGDSFDVREITQRYGEHLIVAVLRGLVSVGDADALLETAYEHMAPSDWGRAYWLIFRDWSDVDEPPPADFVQRLLGLWEWRISELETGPDAAAAVEEAKELGWLFHTPHLPDAGRIRLGLKTVRLAQGQFRMYSQWDGMLSLAQADPDRSYLIAEEVLLAGLQADYPHVPVEDVRPFLAHILNAGNADTRRRARRLVNRLGEQGYRQLKDLLDEDGEAGG